MIVVPKGADVFFVFKYLRFLQHNFDASGTSTEGKPRISPLDQGNARKRLDLDAGLVVQGTEIAGGAGVHYNRRTVNTHPMLT